MAGDIPRRRFGKTNEQVSVLGIGGAHIGFCEESVGIRIIQQAIDAGVNFLDNAWEYNDGESERRMGKALKEQGSRDKVFLMTKDCAHDRRAHHSMWKLETSLKRLGVDHIDLWQLHECNWEDDPDRIFASGGSAEALLKAKEQGKVRFIGFTGHHNPRVHKRMLSFGFPFDSVQMPINVFDAHYDSFEKQVVPVAQEQDLGIIGMKAFAAGDLFKSGAKVTPQEALRYAMSAGVSTTVSGIDSIEVLEQNLAVAQGFQPLSDDERADILSRSAAASADGVFERFKSSWDFEGNESRVFHEVELK